MSKTTTTDGRRAKRNADEHELNSKMAKEFDESLPLVSYHVRILRELDCIELVRTTPRRGAIEHHYRALTRAFLDEDDWAQMPMSAKKSLTATTINRALGDMRAAVDANTFDERNERHLSFSPLLLDEDGWIELNDKMLELLNWALEAQAEAAVRIRDGAPQVRARLTMMSYTGPEPSAVPESAKRKRARR